MNNSNEKTSFRRKNPSKTLSVNMINRCRRIKIHTQIVSRTTFNDNSTWNFLTNIQTNKNSTKNVLNEKSKIKISSIISCAIFFSINHCWSMFSSLHSWLKKMSSKFGVYHFLLFRECWLVTAYLFFWASPVNSAWLTLSICIVRNRRLEAMN
jgi:hypothetical protein